MIDCLGEKQAKVVAIEKTERGYRIAELCDEYYGTTLSQGQFEQLIAELQVLAGHGRAEPGGGSAAPRDADDGDAVTLTLTISRAAYEKAAADLKDPEGSGLRGWAETMSVEDYLGHLLDVRLTG